jgi:hypothetical protein
MPISGKSETNILSDFGFDDKPSTSRSEAVRRVGQYAPLGAQAVLIPP